MRQLIHVALFLVGLFTTAWWIRTCDEMPFWGKLRDKATFLADHQNDYDTLFLGSSRVHNGFVPAVFDARMHELGIDSSTMNFGQSGLRQHDYAALLDWLLANKPPRLRRLMIELHAWDQGPRNRNWMTSHEIEIHPLQHLPTRLVSIFLDRHGLTTKVEHAWHATMHSLANHFRVGQGPRILDAVVDRAYGRLPWRQRRIHDHGWRELSTETVTNERRLEQHTTWRADPGPATRMLASKRADLTPPDHRGGFNVTALRSQVARLRAAGIEPVYVVMPHVANNFFGRDGIESVRDEVTILEFDVVQEHEDLYELQHWFDWAHMMRSGAEMFSARLADRIAALD